MDHARPLAETVAGAVQQFAADMSFFRTPAVTERDVSILTNRVVEAVQKESQKATHDELDRLRRELATERMQRRLLADEVGDHAGVLLEELEAAHSTIKLLLRDRPEGTHTFNWSEQEAVKDLYLRITQDEDEENTTIKLTADPD